MPLFTSYKVSQRLALLMIFSAITVPYWAGRYGGDWSSGQPCFPWRRGGGRDCHQLLHAAAISSRMSTII